MASTTLAPPESRKLLAPIWHTVVLAIFVFATGYFQSRPVGHLENHNIPNRIVLYLTTIGFELILLAYVWFLGVRRSGTRFKDVIGGKWTSAGDLLRDIGIAFLFWLVVAVFLVVVRVALGENTDMQKVLLTIMPRSSLEMAVWVLLSSTAGFCEEFIFRGYLQKQFFALTGSDGVAIVGQAIIFGAAHGYQGIKGMITITLYGALFGLLANMRKSLRPGMIQHALQDSAAGIGLRLLSKSKYFPHPPGLFF